MPVSISKGNSKMGAISSVSLPPIATCRVCDCYTKCYARKLLRFRPSLRKAYENNLEILENDPEAYWREVEAAIMLARFFRFHVAGDIPNSTYFRRMLEVSKRNPHCEILCFTKRYDIVNNAVNFGGVIPENLHIIFSAWPGLEMENPHEFPVAHVRFKNGTTTASRYAKECGGNCTNCAKTGEGCWTLKSGEEVVFNEH